MKKFISLLLIICLSLLGLQKSMPVKAQDDYPDYCTTNYDHNKCREYLKQTSKNY